MQLTPYVSEALGTKQAYGNRLAQIIWNWWKPSHFPPGYWLAKCHPNGPWDLDPKGLLATRGLGFNSRPDRTAHSRNASDAIALARKRKTVTVQPETHYAKSGNVNIAYQVLGDGPPTSLSSK
jgi:hypothetical protein